MDGKGSQLLIEGNIAQEEVLKRAKGQLIRIESLTQEQLLFERDVNLFFSFQPSECICTKNYGAAKLDNERDWKERPKIEVERGEQWTQNTIVDVGNREAVKVR